MKAAVLNKYDKKDIRLQVQEVPMPRVGENEVLVKIKAAGVNPVDNMITRGEVKLIVPYKTPLVAGNEFSGVVECVGTAVRRFQPGDRVYGRMPLDKIGAFAEYAAVRESALAAIPSELDFEQAATVPLTALTAKQAFDLMRVKSGKRIFISGGTGSLGAMAIPLAKAQGLYVITNGNGASEARVKALGADEFIDYKKQDYAAVMHDVDYVLDSLGEKELEKEFSLLKSGGTLVSLKALPNKEFAVRMGLSKLKQFLFGAAGGKYDKMAAMRHQKYYFVFVHEDGEGLEQIGMQLVQGGLQTSIDGVYFLDQINEALEKVDSGKSKGKTIIKLY